MAEGFHNNVDLDDILAWMEQKGFIVTYPFAVEKRAHEALLELERRGFVCTTMHYEKYCLWHLVTDKNWCDNLETLRLINHLVNENERHNQRRRRQCG